MALATSRPSVTLRPAIAADVGCLVAIELEAFPDPSWLAADFLDFDCVVAEVESAEKKVIAGFLVSRENFAGTTGTPPEREILNFAVAAEFRRLGIGFKLLQHEAARGTTVFLEVRENNPAALQLYKKIGFIELFRRRDYYDNPVESAIVMRLK